LEFDDYNKIDVMYHFVLMDQAGLLRCERETSSTTLDRVIRAFPFSLTWQGYELLEASRNVKLWNKAKELIIQKSSGLSLDVLKALLISMAKENVGL
jgi:hypothetical protein